jgi:hypothetical protein
MRLWLALVVALALALAVGIACTGGDSVEKGCQTREDCPRPDRQLCQVETGVCVGFTSLPGQVDGGDVEQGDAGLP